MDGVSGSELLVIGEIARRHGIGMSDAVLAPTQGQVNITVFLGSDLVLRIARTVDPARASSARPTLAVRLAKEAEVIPLARSIGVPTPAILEFDGSPAVIGRPYLVLERVHADDLGASDTARADQVDVYRSLGAVLARLHTIDLPTAGSIPGVAEPHPFDPRSLLDRLERSGEVGSSQRAWLLGWFDRLAELWNGPVRPVLLHGDVSPPNVLIDPMGSSVVALIDWGDADWGDPVRDFVDLPIRALPPAIEGYLANLEESSTPDGHRAGGMNGYGAGDVVDPRADPRSKWCAGALWYQLFWALARLFKDPATSEERHWAAPRHARLLELMRFLTSSPPAPWDKLLM